MGEVFIKLLNMSITASWLILAVLCVRLLFRNIPKWVNCLLWGVVAIRLVSPFSIESELSLQPSAEPIKSSTMAEGEVVPYVPSVDSNLAIVENTVNPILAETFAYQESESMAPLQVFMGIAGSAWLCGMAVLLVFAVGSMVRLYLLVRESVRYKENVYICDAVKSPFILGTIKPGIYLSSALSEDEMGYIIAHEKAHLKRKDHLWKPLGYLLVCVYWFNPLCWIAYIMLCKDIELACDEKVIKNMSFGDKKEYSKVLLSCVTGRRLVFAYPLAFGEVGVKERVKSVLKYKKPAFGITMVAIVVCVVVAICFLTNPSREYQIRVTIPAGSTAAFCYSDEEISPKGNTLTIANGEGLGDTAVMLLPVEYREENAYEPTYMTPGMPVKMDVEKGAWFKIGVNMQNPTTEDIYVYVSVGNVEVRIASEENAESDDSIYGNIVAGLGDNDAYALLAKEADMDMEGLQKELERVVSSVGLGNAYPWNNTAELKEGADALIKMASDETGRFEIYGIMSAKYGTYGLLLNDWIDGEQNWNFAYVPWCYSGAPSEQPILEPDGNGKYVFAYVYKYDDVPWWEECILDCGYDTGHMELLSQEEYAEKPGADIENPVVGEVMVDASAISSIVVINGNTGERKTLTNGYYGYNDLIKLYRQLDFMAEYEENSRVGYQYCMMLQDADGNKLQMVTPYKDGVTVDGIFYQYEDTGNNAAASLRLMEYLEYIFYPEQSSMTKPLTEVPVNTLQNVTMTMEKYKSWEGDIEIVNQTGSELQTGQWYDIQKLEDGAWHRVDQLTDGMLEDVAYRLPAGETTLLQTNWKTLYGELPPGQYRIVKEVFVFSEDRIDSHYLATEFEIK